MARVMIVTQYAGSDPRYVYRGWEHRDPRNGHGGRAHQNLEDGVDQRWGHEQRADPQASAGTCYKAEAGTTTPSALDHTMMWSVPTEGVTKYSY